MENLVHSQTLAEYFSAELTKQLEAYDQSLVNDEAIEIRKQIAHRIVEIENGLISLNAEMNAVYSLPSFFSKENKRAV